MDIRTKEWGDIVVEGAQCFGILIDSEQLGLLRDHASELVKWNRKINLTTITDSKEMALKHYVDAIAVLKWLPLSCNLIDIGTGGGFPGIPIGIIRPELSITLIDASRKKINFLKDVIRRFKLENMTAHQIRVEDMRHQLSNSMCFDVGVSRAFSSLSDFIRLTLPLLKPEGRLIAMKGADVSHELEELNNLSCKDRYGKTICLSDLDIQTFKYRLPQSDDGRSVVIIRRHQFDKSSG